VPTADRAPATTSVQGSMTMSQLAIVLLALLAVVAFSIAG
jgi:hypothetical protein